MSQGYSNYNHPRIVEALSKKYGIKSPQKFKDRKEEKIYEDDDENDDDNDSIAEVDNEDEEGYEPTIEEDIT